MIRHVRKKRRVAQGYGRQEGTGRLTHLGQSAVDGEVNYLGQSQTKTAAVTTA
jgi:hypothetical protein